MTSTIIAPRAKPETLDAVSSLVNPLYESKVNVSKVFLFSIGDFASKSYLLCLLFWFCGPSISVGSGVLLVDEVEEGCWLLVLAVRTDISPISHQPLTGMQLKYLHQAQLLSLSSSGFPKKLTINNAMYKTANTKQTARIPNHM